MKNIKELNRLKYDTYVLNIIRKVKNDYSIKDLTNINITDEEYNLILNTINKDILDEKINVIYNIVENEYNELALKILKNKKNYIEENIKNYYDLIVNLEDKLKKEYNIKNELSLHYLKNISSKYIINNLNNKTIINIFIELNLIYTKYNEIYKRLYKLTNNSNELNKIIEYENIENNYYQKKLVNKKSR